ncbi:hypothetical protein OPV22_018755 [Ensete ventricosum]|uniref:YTH domain-containing protein n=1 Tax=Ensete ventricosum TaxID=4639 RepID=A0AAV8R2P2_ENSVE|nr:hypothetical protein OPV22_018755 [Ensete ventricosum]
METSQQALDRTEPLESSTVDGDQKPVNVENLNKQPPSAIDEKVTTSNASDESSNVGLPRDAQDHFGSSDAVNDDSIIFPPNNLPPPAHVFWYRGYENPIADEYSQHLNVEGLEVGSTGVYNENRSLVYHTGYGSSSSQQGAFPVDTSSFNTHLFGPRPGYQLSYGSFGRDWLRSPEGTGSVTPLSPPAASPQPVGALMSFGQNTMPPTFGMASQQHSSLYGFGSSINSSHGGLYNGSTYETSFPSFGFKDQSSIALDRRSGGKGTMYSRNGNLDFLNEQNRGPRASRTNNQMTEHNPSLDNRNSSSRVDRKFFLIFLGKCKCTFLWAETPKK